jgi:histidine triad (HIT) family protein
LEVAINQKNCIFCQIATGSIPATLLSQNNEAYIINDLHPQAPTHWLVIPKKHVELLEDLSSTDVSHMHQLASQLIKQRNITTGFRVIINSGIDAGQEVPHVHMHILAGEPLGPIRNTEGGDLI